MSEDRFQRELRKALRSDEDGLSPGFYARTVGRFESERKRLPLGLSWSTVGLAAAAIAAALIFIPMALREELPVPEPVRVQDESRPPAGDVAEEVEEKTTPGRDLRQDAPVLADPAEPEIALGGLVGDDADHAKEQVVAIPEQKRRVELPAPTAPLVKIAMDTEPTGPRVQTLVAAVEVPSDTVGIGEVELLETFSAKKSGESSAVESERDSFRARSQAAPASRFVAIGPRPGLDTCAALILRRTDRTWEIDYEDSGSRTGSVACRIEIPGDGLEIRFQGWRVDE